MAGVATIALLVAAISNMMLPGRKKSRARQALGRILGLTLVCLGISFCALAQARADSAPAAGLEALLVLGGIGAWSWASVRDRPE